MATTYTIIGTGDIEANSLALIIDRDSDARPTSYYATRYSDLPIVIRDEGDARDTLTGLAEALGLCGGITEVREQIVALRHYAAVREALGLGDRTTDADAGTPHTRDSLDYGDDDDLAELAATVADVHGGAAGRDYADSLGLDWDDVAATRTRSHTCTVRTRAEYQAILDEEADQRREAREQARADREEADEYAREMGELRMAETGTFDPRGVEPLDEEEQAEHRAEAKRLGVRSDSRVFAAYIRGLIDEDECERVGEITRRRHETTSYDDLLARGMSRDDARDLMQ